MNMKNLFGGRSATMVALGACLLGGCGLDEPAPVAEAAPTAAALAGGEANPAVYPIDARPFGHDLLFWAEEWWRYVYSVPPATNPFLHPTLDSNQGQAGPVLFLLPGNRTNTVPQDWAIAVVTSTLLNDFPCPDPTFQPAPGQSLFDFLLSGISPVNDAVVEVSATLDGQVLNDLMTYRVASDDLTSIVGDLSLQTSLDSCITGSSQPAVVDSFIFLLKPLEPGRHVLTTNVVTASGHAFPHTQLLDVQ